MFLHEETPSNVVTIDSMKANDGGRLYVAKGSANDAEQLLIGHRKPYNVGDPVPPIRWYRVSAYAHAV